MDYCNVFVLCPVRKEYIKRLKQCEKDESQLTIPVKIKAIYLFPVECGKFLVRWTLGIAGDKAFAFCVDLSSPILPVGTFLTMLLTSVASKGQIFKDEAVAGTDSTPPQEDCKAHQELLRRVAQNLGIQVEEIRESSHSVVDILEVTGPARVALTLNDAIMDPIRALWQTPASFQLTAKKTERKYFVLTKGLKFLYTHPPPGSLVVLAAYERKRQG
ncbi:hypothetical protein UY3_19093 [Chelonia mydas]|uniref:Uncharacterized protein n=1 Tax=Chelonia mydas TaxID=8469 RepID=M7AVR4_CHEMY|nr:hypothetical protein UY3_19093 [Chelonia mydas]